MDIPNSSSGAFQLPPEIVELCDLANRIVREELLPLEQEFLPHPGHGFGIKETLNLEAVFGGDVVAKLTC